ncbi:MAG: 50S ribosomal protein L4 [Candidatus Caenarcaniphilales bacterium]|nr:50S ribosomal protein L4 [Candidatus Caenarcaniphilales bacterium]
MKLELINKQNKKVGDIDLSDDVFLEEPSPHLVHELLLLQHKRKARLASTKTRTEVRGGGAKPWRQKGTGRARAGSSRSPLFRGGGVIFGPRYHLIKNKMPKRARLKALCSALSLKKEEIIILDKSPEIKLPKTKDALSFLEPFKVEGKKILLLVDGSKDTSSFISKSFSNIPKCKVLHWQNLNPHDLFNSEVTFVDQETLREIESWLLTRKLRKGMKGEESNLVASNSEKEGI